ncbi:tetratricopeptide repeat protein [Sphingomonas sp. RT2P30]|uniref:tetratricopeptide repeat protein n=1 Tax=Parasphingomonas halimpatiens TaxID=3096162 RepID=UPI002FCC24DA
MAVPPNTNEAFLREVDEELRRDQLATAWRRYGRWVVLAVLGGLAALGGWLYWQHYQQQRSNAEGEKLLAAYDQSAAGKDAQAAPVYTDLAASSSPGYRAAARFAQADVLLKKNDLKAAAAKFAEVAADQSIAQPFRDLALIRQTTAEYDQLKPQVVVDRLRLLAQKGNPWFGSAGELVGAAYLQMDRRELAQKLFSQMSTDDGVPESIRKRAGDMAAALGASVNQEKKAQ